MMSGSEMAPKNSLPIIRNERQSKYYRVGEKKVTEEIVLVLSSFN